MVIPTSGETSIIAIGPVVDPGGQPTYFFSAYLAILMGTGATAFIPFLVFGPSPPLDIFNWVNTCVSTVAAAAGTIATWHYSAAMSEDDFTDEGQALLFGITVTMVNATGNSTAVDAAITMLVI